MATRALTGLRSAQLRWRLLAFFAALALPAALLFWLGYGRLNWEVFHQYRAQAEALTRAVDRDLSDGIAALERLSFEDYSYLSGAGDAADAIVQRSPIAAWPVDGGLPGLIGYFQVDAEGAFSSPLVPRADAAIGKLGIDPAELSARRERAQQILNILSDNRLVARRPASRSVSELARTAGFTGPASPASDGRYAPGAAAPTLGAEAVTGPGSVERERDAASSEQPGAPPASRSERQDEEGAAARDASYDQGVFDALNSRAAARSAAGRRPAATPAAMPQAGEDADRADKLSALRLDDRLQQKSEQAEARKRARLSELAADETGMAAEPKEDDAAFAEREPVPADARASIATFRRDTGGYELGVLDSGHLVLFRDAYRDGERFIQGALLERGALIGEAIGAPFERAAVSAMASLIVALGDDVVASVAGAAAGRDGADPASGTLLYRSRLVAPLDRLELVYTVDRLPAGAGARVLVWTGVAFALILAAGMLLLYRLGAGQIALARQQQDFVAAVSHELKTPLTSIRMYAEMLSEGWVGEDKRSKYYRYIHDESERLTRLIANVLQLARITRNETEPELQPHKVGALLADTEARIANQVAHAGFELRMRVDAAAAGDTVKADSDAVAQIMINLVDNAIKFSTEGAERVIEVGARRGAGESVVLFVRDFGPGVSPDQMKKIFQLFYRPESELTRETVGTGIGLAIVRELSAAMGGRVDCVNRTPGAEFQVALPRLPQENRD